MCTSPNLAISASLGLQLGVVMLNRMAHAFNAPPVSFCTVGLGFSQSCVDSVNCFSCGSFGLIRGRDGGQGRVLLALPRSATSVQSYNCDY